MKRCPTCQTTYAEETTFCLHDGSPLVSVEPGATDAPPTAQTPPPRATGQPYPPYPPPPQPFYPPPGGTGFKVTNKILGISGGGLLLLGTFMPIISVLGLLNFSLFTFIQGVPTGPGPGPGPGAMPDAVGVLLLLRFVGIAVLLLGAGSLALAFKNQLKPLAITGGAALVILIFIFIKLQMLFSTVPGEFRAVVGIGWGYFALVAAAILLIVAGVKKEQIPPGGTGWTNSPPPPMNYH